MLASRIAEQTREGTDFWGWFCWCKSDSFHNINLPGNHNDHAVYWTYDHNTWADKRSVEIPAFKDMCEMYYSLLESIFGYVNYEYHQSHGGD